MAISIDWKSRVIYVPKAYMTLIQSTPIEIRELNINQFRLDLKALEAGEEGMMFDDTHRHNTEVLLGGIVYARVIEIINGYTVTFENGAYAVNLVGANSNIGDVINLNTVSVRSNNAAGLISNSAIEYSSFNGGVTVDTSSSFSGTTFPVGTPQAPVNNMADALLIASVRGFTRFYIIGDIGVDSGGSYKGLVFEGESPTKSQITVSDIADVEDCEFENVHVLGVLDGGSTLRGCLVTDLTYVDGYIEQCVLGLGTILLSGAEAAFILDCWSGVAGVGTPTIDLGGSGSALNVRGYNGGIKLINKTGSDKVSMDINSGQVILDSTVTVSAQDEIVVRGVGTLTNNAVNPEYVNSYGLISLASIVTATLDAVYIDTVNGEAGTEFPIGTPTRPVNNLTDARTIADKQGIKEYRFRGPLTIDVAHEGFAITGTGSILTDVLTIADVSIANTKFTRCTVTGTVSGTDVQYDNCALSNLSGVQGLALSSSIWGTLTIAPAASFVGRDLEGATNPSTIDLVGGGGHNIQFSGVGVFAISNAVATDLVLVGISIGAITVNPSCVTGSVIAISGDCMITNNGVGAYVVDQTLVTRIMEEPLSGHSPEDSLANMIKRILGLGHEHFRVLDGVHDTDGNLTSATVKTYKTKVDCDADTSPLAVYAMTATFSGPGKMASFKQVRTDA